MYGSYSSYSSSYGTSMPMDIRPSYLSSRPQDDASSCAFPAWPRRTSLCGDEAQQRATSFLSDEDLEPLDPCFDDDARSISSAGTASPADSPRQATALAPAALLTEADFLELERQQVAYQREVMRFLLSEKSKRQAMRRQRRGSAGSSSSGSRKNSPSKGSSGGNSKLVAAMTPIAE